jgi:hypothetical protein
VAPVTFLLTVEDRVVDVDALWAVLVAGLTPTGPVGRPGVTLAIACGLRLGLDRPTLAAALLTRLEQRMAHEDARTPEEAEVTLRKLTDELLHGAELQR